MLKVAASVLRTGSVRYARRRGGLVYERREFEARFGGSDRVDFWVCDALALPFADGRFQAVVAMNLIDCVASPVGLLGALRRALRDGGSAWMASPYDWSTAATTVEGWIGGHSQRGEDSGSSPALLRRLLTAGAHPQSIQGLELRDEADGVDWRVRLHDRSAVAYRVHVVRADAVSPGSPGAPRLP